MNNVGKIFYVILIALVLYIAGTSAIYRIKNPSKTETEILLHTWGSMMLEFETLKNE